MKIVLICPYFGKLPNYFDYVLKSCEFNTKINWLIFTDDTQTFNYPKNVEVVYMKFEQFREMIQSKFDFKINLENPYKLCDYKPLYGYVLEEYLKEFDYWGHCDIDCIFGDLHKFINEAIKNNYEKIFYLGHLTIYKNKQEVNKRFMLNVDGKSYLDVLQTNEICVFDEAFEKLSMNTIYKTYNYNFYKKQIFADISCLYYDFRLYQYNDNLKYSLENRSNKIFQWQEGKVYSIELKDNNIESQEYGYVHFQKRKINIERTDIDSIDSFILKPNEIIVSNEVKKEILNQKRKYFYIPFLKQKYKALKHRINNWRK